MASGAIRNGPHVALRPALVDLACRFAQCLCSRAKRERPLAGRVTANPEEREEWALFALLCGFRILSMSPLR